MDLVVPPWIPEDDLLLKNAVEAGASLESLAKGAVQFSRKYSIVELRDRWLSLLYDPDISAEASASMASLELSGPGAASRSSGSGIKEGLAEGAAKRKVPSIRRQYYAMRKRLCRQVFDSYSMALHDEMNIGDSVGDGSACEKNAVGYDESLAKNFMEGGKLERKFGLQETGLESGKIDNGVSLVHDNLNKDMNHLLVNNLVDYGNYSGLEEVGPSHSMPEVPLWKTIEDVSVPAMPVQVSLENKNDSSEVGVMLHHGLEGKHANDVLNASVAISGEDITHLSDSLLNLTNGDELLFMDIDGKDATDKPCHDNLDSLLLNSPSEIQGNDAPGIRESQKLDTETKLAMPSSSSATGSEIVAKNCSHGDLHSISAPENDVQSSVAAQSPHSELSEEFMYCALNTEDPDIPSNDIIGHSILVPSSVTLKPHSLHKEADYPDSSINNQRKNEPDGSLKKEDNPSHSFAASQIVRPGLVAIINSSLPTVGVAMKTENTGMNHISAVSAQSNNVNTTPSHSKLVQATMTPRLKQEEIDAPASAKVHAHSKAEDHKEHKDLPKSEVNSLSLDQERDEEDDNDEDDDDDDDNEIPYFSEAETMILEMDLSPTDQDSNAIREVSRYQHEVTKRTIMRLEQCAQSFMQRAIASRGALATFYGRNMKQYIKKSEVILGRSTNDVQVDIDLGREGLANKISRRQALIRMEANGSFTIKNLGKSSIFLNGKEIATGQLRGLSASSLIEIRGMSFIFEVNNKSVRRFLENMDNKSEDKYKTFTFVR